MASHVTSVPRGDDLGVEEAKNAIHVNDVDEKVDYDRAGAIGAENTEHRMGVLEAVKA